MVFGGVEWNSGESKLHLLKWREKGKGHQMGEVLYCDYT